MTTPNPYGADLGGRDALQALAETPGRLREVVERWGEDRFERSYAPGKWTARQVIIHLAQTELALGSRARFALNPGGLHRPVVLTRRLLASGRLRRR